MRIRRIERTLTASLLLLVPLFLRIISASPAINVGLKASWNSAPFLLELLETAAEENRASYFPLLDRISSGTFTDASSDRELYNEFLRIANAEGFFTNLEELSSFNLALSIHAAAPRIEAHYHYYANNLEPLTGKQFDPSCKVWVQWGSKQMCGLEGEFGDIITGGQDSSPNDRRKLQFDRPLETGENKPVVILYADIQAPEFKAHHERLKRHAEAGHVSYRLRYRPPIEREERPVILSGYGVSLVLKKTDYMVMDDRDVAGESGKGKAAVGEKGTTNQQPLGQLEDTETHDIKPLQEKDLSELGYKAASFIMGSDNPFETLQRLVQDFPKHSAAIAAGELNPDVMAELRGNWEMLVGPGKNLLWINGLQMEESQINAFALLEHLRRERKYIETFKSLGLSASETIQLLSHATLTAANEEERIQRFDYRDETEGGKVIVWLNDLEKDKRYNDWTTSPSMLLRRVYPGQLHPIRKNVHNLVIPVDFTSKEDLLLISQNLRLFVQRRIAMRFGLAPLTKTQGAADQAKVVYHLIDAYGLQTGLKYIDTVLDSNDFSKPNRKTYDTICGENKLREGETSMSLEEVLASGSFDERIANAKQWSERLGANAPVPPIFVNGQPVPKDEDWTAVMSAKLQGDIAVAARYVYEQHATEKTDFAAVMLQGAAKRRNAHIFPENDSDIRLINISDAIESNKAMFEKLPRTDTDIPKSTSEASIWIIGDFDEPAGYDLLAGAAELQKDEAGVNLILINNLQSVVEKPALSTLLYQLQKVGFLTPETLRRVLGEVNPHNAPSAEDVTEALLQAVKDQGWSYPDHIEAGNFWKRTQTSLLKNAGIAPGQRAIVINGRVVGPIPKEDTFIAPDFKQLLEYERAKRIVPVLEAAKELGIIEKLQNGFLGSAILTNQVSLTANSEVPAGLFQSPDSTRTDIPHRMLQGKHTAINVGTKDSAIIRIVASIDPASETAQKWVPLLRALSEMNGVHLKIFLNPAKTINELPVKRFYRHVLNSTPEFDDTGRLVSPRARFHNIPQGPLLSLSMDVPPSWLVTPKESIHDLDNLKLDTLKERLRGADIEALYELENILIEGHSRDASGQPPRGAQLVLGTENEPHFADTIIMANLGYFQFKANPGIWKMELKEGRSKQIFNIESFGTKGLLGQRTNEDPDIALMSFQGATLFPRMSRNPGMEDEDVLVPPGSKGGAVDTAKKWFDGIMKSVTNVAATKPQAEINIFSVASGHLYERFLNIMMLSVMKNTKHTVKFWFIENFLSPSFKDFIPIMAKEYGFEYELVTYKWPHWLRAQKEKQREIWGYKILFLDVLFPLDLDKVIFVDADQIVRTDLKELVDFDLEGAPYGFTPMCDSRAEIEGFRFWKQGYWKTFLQGLPYHISALYVVDLKEFRQIAAGDRLRQQYHQLSADPQSLANLDQDLPNHMQSVIPIKSLPQDWLWCETWCSDESLKTAKTIDLCNNPMTKEPKLDRAKRQVPEWVEYDEEVAKLAKRKLEGKEHLSDALKEEGKEEKKRDATKKVKDEL